MTNTTSKFYDQATDTVHHLVETVRDELPDLADVRSAAGEVTHRAGDLFEDVADRAMAFLPGAAARAARTRRRRWMWGGIAAIGLAILFGPGGAERRAAIKSRLSGRSNEAASGAHTSGPKPVGAAQVDHDRIDTADEAPTRNAETA